MENNSKIYYNGSKWKTTNYGINQREFARKYDLNQAGVNSCINGISKQTKGWIFQTKYS